MKIFIKIVLTLVLCMSLSNVIYGQSQDNTIWFRTTHVAMRYKAYNVWSDWSDWQDCEVNIRIDLSNDKIIIYSLEPQIYRVIETANAPYDSNGEQIAFKVIDQDNDIGRLRLRVENNNNTQIYIDFNDVSWAYNIKRIN